MSASPSTARLPFPLAVALRYLKSTRQDAFVSFLSAVAAGGLALGVAALILALAALSGFQQALRREILARTPEIEIELPPATSWAAARQTVTSVAGVTSAQIVTRGRGWLVSRGRVRAVELVGFEHSVPRSFPGAAGGAGGLYVADRLASAWALRRGDSLELASGRPTLTPLGPQPRVRRLQLVGTFVAGRTEQEERVALPLAEAEVLLAGADRRLEVTTGSLARAVDVASRLAPVLPEGSRIRSWQDLNRPLFFALRLEKSMMFVAVFLIVLVAALALVSDLTLIIATKRHEIGMMGAMGATPADLRRIFVLLGGALALVGCIAGSAVGIGGALVLDRFRLLGLPDQVYFLDYVPFLIRGVDLATVLGLSLALALGCAFHAAGRAAALLPVEALRR